MHDQKYLKEEKTDRQKMINEYIGKMNPNIRQSLDRQQNQEVSRLLNRVLPKYGNHIIDIRFRFWLIKYWYFVIQFGKDNRDDKRISPTKAYRTIGTLIINSLFVIILFVLSLILIFFILYLIKSMVGINIFPDKHLKDILKISLNIFPNTIGMKFFIPFKYVLI